MVAECEVAACNDELPKWKTSSPYIQIHMNRISTGFMDYLHIRLAIGASLYHIPDTDRGTKDAVAMRKADSAGRDSHATGLFSGETSGDDILPTIEH